MNSKTYLEKMANSQMFSKESWSIHIDMDLEEEHHLQRLIMAPVFMTPITIDFLDRLMRTQNNEKGQSAVEFILTFAFAAGMTFLFVNQAINLTSGYLMHYVNFMASRAYLVSDSGIAARGSNLAEARRDAEKAFEYYKVEDFGIKADLTVQTKDQGNALFTGTVTQFQKRLSSLPVVGGGESALFYSESFLGKEPLRFSCYQMVCAAMTGSYDACDPEQTNMVLYDNGC